MTTGSGFSRHPITDGPGLSGSSGRVSGSVRGSPLSEPPLNQLQPMPRYLNLVDHALTPAAIVATLIPVQGYFETDPPSSAVYDEIIPHLTAATSPWSWWSRQQDVTRVWEAERQEVLTWWAALPVWRRNRMWKARFPPASVLALEPETIAMTFTDELLLSLARPLRQRTLREDLSRARRLLIAVELCWLSLRTDWRKHRPRLPRGVARLIFWRAYYLSREFRRELVRLGTPRSSLPQQTREELALCSKVLRSLAHDGSPTPTPFR